MEKIGVNLSINVKEIDKARLVAHANGKTYLNMTVFIDADNPGQYGDHGMITQDVSKEEKDQGVKGPILANTIIRTNSRYTYTYYSYKSTYMCAHAKYVHLWFLWQGPTE